MSTVPVNTIKILSPGINPDVDHEVARSFTDGELVDLKKFVSRQTFGDLEDDTTDTVIALRKLFLILEQWHTTSP